MNHPTKEAEHRLAHFVAFGAVAAAIVIFVASMLGVTYILLDIARNSPTGPDMIPGLR